MKNILTLFMLVGFMVFAGSMNISYAQPTMAAEPHSDTSSNEETDILTGKIVETMNSSGYTYFSIKSDGKEVWVAVPEMKLKVGQEVSFRSGNVMAKFESRTLGRKFNTIIFTSALLGEAEEKAETPAAEMPVDSKHGAASSDKKIEKVKVEKVSGPNAYTVAELYAKNSELDTKSIVLKGQVVKVGLKIMGKNWIHIQDGSGSASDKTNDIIVTSQDVPEVGSIVTVNGTLSKDRDFGMGYFYAVIIEEGSIK